MQQYCEMLPKSAFFKQMSNLQMTSKVNKVINEYVRPANIGSAMALPCPRHHQPLN
jgi:hypothetical protein